MVLTKRVCLLLLLALPFTSTSSNPSRAGDLADALKSRDVAQVRSLVSAGADVNENERGDYPLNIAAVYGPAEMVTILLEAGAGVAQPGRDGLHPLHNAVLVGHKDIVALLIQRGALVDAKDRLGRTPIVSFAANGGADIEIAKMLLAAGADPKIESSSDDEKYAALDYAAGTGNLELTELLIAARVDVNHKTANGESALHTAAQTNRLEIVRLLIANGADVNLTNKVGNTPLYYVKDPSLRQLLIAAGAK